MPTVKFEFDVEVDEEFLSDDPSADEIVDEAKEIMFSAPAYDGISEHFISQLETSEIEE